MVHSHSHSHSHSHRSNKKVLLVSLLILSLFMVVEVIGGIKTKSLALISDAGHMLSDSASLLIALLALNFGRRKPTESYTYGFKRFEILAATLNGVTLLLVAGYIVYEAIGRLVDPPSIEASGMLYIAIGGLLVNLLVAYIMVRGGDVKQNLNMRGAYQHVLSDLLGSLAAVAAALLIMGWGWQWADPLCSLLVALLILRSGYLITKDAVHVLMEGVPKGVELNKIRAALLGHPQVEQLHHLHVWSLSSGLNSLSVHVVVKENKSLRELQVLRAELEAKLIQLEIEHTTLQFEPMEHGHSDSLLCESRAPGH